MKRFIRFALLVALVIVSVTASAQSKMTEEQKKEAKARYEAYKQKLNLNEEQSKKVEEINTAFFAGMSELKSSGASKLSKYRKYKSLQSQKDKQMKEVLTKDQYKIYLQFQQEMKSTFKENRRNG
jgi:mannitol-specific phosphotransferase system IIBC component